MCFYLDSCLFQSLKTLKYSRQSMRAYEYAKLSLGDNNGDCDYNKCMRTLKLLNI